VADLVTPEELGDFLKIPNLDAGNAAPVIAGVSAAVRRYTGRAWEKVDDEVVRLEGNGSSSLLLPKLPVRDVSSIVEDPDGRFGTPVTLSLDVQVEWDETGRVRRVDGGIFLRRLRFYEVTYSHGLETGETVPGDVKLVVLRVCARGAVNPEGLAQESVTGYTAVFGQDATRLAVLSPPDERELDAYRVSV
jgi:hypothetical protein